MNKLGKCLAALCIVVLGVPPALAAPIGTALGVNPEADISQSGTQRTLVVGTDILLGDLVRTTEGGRVDIEFQDGTKLVVGPASSLLIEDYLLREDGSAGNFAIGALAGTFRFISGSADKERYRISTPTGTIGIRGTAFDLVVDANRGDRVLMYSGATTLCPTGGECSTISETCELGEMTRGSATSLGMTDQFTRDDRRELRTRFVFGGSQQSLGSDFRLTATAECLLSPLQFTPAFFRSVNGPASAALGAPVAPSGVPAVPDAAPVPGAPVVPEPTAPPPPVVSGGDCAGNSDNNPGKSKNCDK